MSNSNLHKHSCSLCICSLHYNILKNIDQLYTCITTKLFNDTITVSNSVSRNCFQAAQDLLTLNVNCS